MKHILKIGGIVIGSMLIILIAGAAILYIATAGDYNPPATVSDDPSLPRIKIDGYAFHAETYGNPQHPVVIVLHGGPGGDYRSLLGLQTLSDEYFIVFYDQRGAGLSTRVPAEQLTLRSSIEDLDAIVDRYSSVEPVHLIGHSWGAILASAYLGYAPQKVAKTVMAEPGFLTADELAEWRNEMNSIISGSEYIWIALRTGFEARHVEGSDEYAADDYLIGTMAHYFTNHPDNPYHCPGEPFDAPSWRFGAASSNGIQGSATPADLNSISSHAGDYTKPVLFLAGECDTWIGAGLQSVHAEIYPNAQLVVIPDAGHDMFWDNPDETLSVVRDFLGE